MRIDQLAIQNFRCFTNLTLDLHPEFNVIIGENAAGKTALLQAISVAVGCWFLKLDSLNPPRIEIQDVRRTTSPIGDEYQSRDHYPVLVKATGIILTSHFTWYRRRNSAKATSRSTKEIEDLSAATADLLQEESREAEEVILPIVAYYRAGRLWQTADPDTKQRRPMKPDELSRLEGYRGALTRWSDPNELMRWLERQDRISYQERRQPILYRVVREVMCNMIEGAVDVRFDNRILDLIVAFADGSVQPFQQLSDGQRNMLALAGDLAVRMARLNPQLGEYAATNTPGVILIDEIDLHLHPRWQRHVATDLRRVFPKAQFVVSTHSPQVISEIEPQCVRIISKSNDDQMIITKPTQAFGLDTNSVLENIMGTITRPTSIQRHIDAADDALEFGEWDKARALVSDLRRLLHGDDPEVARLDASTATLEILADAVD